MSLVLRTLLIAISILSMIVMIRKIRHAKFQIEYAIFWIIFSFVLIVIAVFPEIMMILARLVGIQSPVNMIFLMIIFVLLAKMFYLNIQISHLEYKVKELVQKLALNEHKETEEKADDQPRE